MKTFTASLVAAMLALSAISAHAQAKRPSGEEKKQGPQKPAVDEKAYKAALEKIPDSKEKYDPWGVARPAEPAKKSK
ncbi:MAG: hypothetical protein ABW175_00585 [Bradyrhizobium sp.]